MKRTFVLFLVFVAILPSCGVDNAEKIADLFHQKMDEHNHQYIVDELCDPVMFATNPDEMMDFLKLVDTWGPMKNREKTSGFSLENHGAYKTVKLNYTFENDFGLMYEGLVLVDRGIGYQLMTVVFNQNKSVVDNDLSEY